MARLTRTNPGRGRITAVRYRRRDFAHGLWFLAPGHDAGSQWGPHKVALGRGRRAYIEAGGRVGHLGFRSVPILHDPREVS